MSVICQFESSWQASIRSWDFLGLIPGWRFFAPQPSTGDYHLLYRDRFEGKGLGLWREVRLADDFRWWHAFWNPQRRAKKSLFDLTTELARDLSGSAKTTPELTIPFLVLLNYVVERSRDASSNGTQFMIMRSFGSGALQEPAPVYLSTIHDL